MAYKDEKTTPSPPTNSPPSGELKEGEVVFLPVTAPGYIKPQARKLHDPAVTFEEYRYYALLTREEEKRHAKPKTGWHELVLRKKPQQHATDEQHDEQVDDPTHLADVNFSNQANRVAITDEEWSNASRAFRTASSGACFYLITTDILGPYGVGFAMGTLGWMPGIILYTVFGFMAGYSGYLIWKMFLGLDSYQFPCRNYSDLGYRLLGSWARHIMNVGQALSLLLILGLVAISNGQALSQVSRFRLCYAVCPIIFVLAGFLLGQVRTLRKFGLVANFAVWLNLLVIFITMGVMAHSPPNYSISVLGSAGALVDPDSITPNADGIYPPVTHYTYLPDPGSLVGSLNGLMSGVLAYGGAQLFVEFMAEMRRPTDFLKAMWSAQFFIYTVYMVYGCFVYYYQGQYAYSISYQGVSLYGWQTAGNMLALGSGLIAAALYGNIGIKVLYNSVLIDLLGAPPLTTQRGKFLYAAIVPVWWTIAYIIAGAIPDFYGFVSVISSGVTLEFTYCFPPMLAVAYQVQLSAMQEGEGFDPRTGTVVRRDRGLRRWLRGFVSGPWYMNVFHVLYALGGWVTAGLGMYAAIQGMIDAFKNPQINSFTCQSPLNLGA